MKTKYLFNGVEIQTENLKNYRPIEWQDNYQTIILRELTVEEKIEELENWFDNYFDKQFTQSQWQDDFKPSYDNLFKKEYKNISELKTQAQVVRNQIKELRGK